MIIDLGLQKALINESIDMKRPERVILEEMVGQGFRVFYLLKDGSSSMEENFSSLDDAVRAKIGKIVGAIWATRR